MTEARDIIAAPANRTDGWPDAEPYRWIVEPWTAEKSRRVWLARFHVLSTNRFEVAHG